MRILDAKEPLKIKEHSRVIDIFRPELDVVGLTTYPSPFHKRPADLVPDYYSWVYRHARKTDEILLISRRGHKNPGYKGFKALKKQLR